MEYTIIEDKTKIINHINNFDSDVNNKKLFDFYSSKSFLEILLVDRREISHSSFLAWLFNSQENHQLSDFALKRFIEIIDLRHQIFNNNDNIDVIKSIILESYNVKNIVVEKEKHLGKARLDIYVEFVIFNEELELKIKLIIENKVKSNESDDQTIKYFNHFEKIKRKNEINFFIYLTPLSSLELISLAKPECICDNYIQINYQDIVDTILEPALLINISDRTKFIISEYIKSLSQPSITDKSLKNIHIMALGKEEKELLIKFWTNNKDIILSAMYANSINDDLATEEREIIKTAYDSIVNGTGIGKSVQESFKNLCDKNLLDNFVDKLCDKNYSKSTFNIGQSLLIQKTNDENCGIDEKGYQRYYKKNVYQINNLEFLLNMQWTNKNIGLFENWLKQFN